MRTEAESHAEEDRRRMEEVDARNRLDGIVYQAEKMVRENRDKIAEADAKSLDEAIEDAKKAMNEGGTARLRSATENIERQLHKVAEVLYKANQAAGAAQAGAAGAGAGTGAGPAARSQQQKKTDDVIHPQYCEGGEKKRPNKTIKTHRG